MLPASTWEAGAIGSVRGTAKATSANSVCLRIPYTGWRDGLIREDRNGCDGKHGLLLEEPVSAFAGLWF